MKLDACSRNAWLRPGAGELERTVRMKRTRCSGPGGQRRNKVETGVVLEHVPSSIVVRAGESRSAEVNRSRALARLRERIACDLRCPWPSTLPPEMARDGRGRVSLRLSRTNPAYHVVLATVLDALQASGGSFAGAADLVGTTTSQVVRFLETSKAGWQAVARLREGRQP